MSIIEAEGISADFRRGSQKRTLGAECQQVLFDVSFHVEEGRCLGVLGKNGNGKSTLDRVLCGFLEPDKGSMRLDGSWLYGGKKNRNKTVMSVVLRDYTTSASPRFKVRDLIAESLTVREKKEGIKMDMERELEHFLDLVGLNMGYRDRFPYELSGGQLRRACIARAITVNPRIILFDGAIGLLDAHTQVQVMGLLKEIQRRRDLTYVFITHDLTSVTYICHNALSLCRGRVAEVREVDCISQVEHLYTKELLNSIVEFDDRGIISREEKERRTWEKTV